MTAAALAALVPAEIVKSCIGGIIGNRTDGAVIAIGRGLAALTGSTEHPTILVAMMEAFAGSIEDTVRACQSAGQTPADRFVREDLNALVKCGVLRKIDLAGFEASDGLLDEQVRAIYGQQGIAPQTAATDQVLTMVEAAIGRELTPAFRSVFYYGHLGSPGWAGAFELRFSRSVQEKDALFRILMLDRVNEIASGMGDANAKLDAILTRMEGVEAGVPRETVIALAMRVAETVDDTEGAVAQLHAAIDELLALRDRAERGTNLGDLMDDALRRIAARNERQQFDDAAEEGERFYAELVKRQQAERLAIADAMIAQSRVRADAASLARWTEERLRIEHGEVMAELLFHEVERFGDEGRTHALPLSLDVAILLAEQAIALARTPRENGRAQNYLGNALLSQGDRSAGKAGQHLLARAIAAFEAALEVCTLKTMPAAWAAIQNNLGSALLIQGERSSSEEDLELFARAVAAIKAALRVYTRESGPTRWAMGQTNMGNALFRQGQRISGKAGFKLLARSATAYDVALDVLTREEMPAQWAMTQNNLGNALATLGQRSGGKRGVSLLARAVVAYKAAQQVRTREHMPARWAETQNNLGAALHTQGDLCGGKASLELLDHAVAAYVAALDVSTRREMPADWAMTRSNMGFVEESIADREARAAALAHLRAAEQAFLDALTVYTPDEMGHYYEKCSAALARVREKIAKLEGGD